MTSITFLNSEPSSVSVDLNSHSMGPAQAVTRCTVFCDLDGPLIDVSQRYYKTYRLALDITAEHYLRQGIVLPLTPLSQLRFWNLKLERIPDTDIANLTGFQDEQIDFFLSTVRTVVNRPDLLHEDQLQPWASEALEYLHQFGASLFLVTLRQHDQAIQMLKRFGIYHYFERVQGSTDEFAAYDNYASCKTAMLQKLVKSKSLANEALWMIGDTEADVLSAKALGISSIALSCGMRSMDYLKRLEPTCVFGNLSQAARYVTHHSANFSDPS